MIIVVLNDVSMKLEAGSCYSTALGFGLHAAKHHHRHFSTDAATTDQNGSAHCHRQSKSPGALPPKKLCQRRALPRTRLVAISDRSLHVTPACAWNSLTNSVTTATFLVSFKRQLKHFYSQSGFWNCSLIVYHVLEALLLMLG